MPRWTCALTCLAAWLRHRVRIVTNMGAANPEGAAEAVARIARRLGARLPVGILTGDDVREAVVASDAHGKCLGSALLGLEI